MTIYTYDQALAASTEYFNGDELAAKVFVDKYAMRNDNREIIEETPDDMHRRIAAEFARIERVKFDKPMSFDEIYETLKGFNRIVPQGGPMFGIGNPNYITLSNCYVVSSPEDSYGSICLADQRLVQISKRRGGVGMDLSHLRPNGSPTKNSSRSSTGPVCFAKRYSHSIREVGQDGRRGALMLTLSVHHPDVVEFAESKQKLEEITGANISIRITDEFMNAVMEDAEYEQRWPVEGEPQVSHKVSARKVWKTIIKCAWKTAEPGLLFWDNIVSESPADCYADDGFRTISTNPCCFAESSTVHVVTSNGIKDIKRVTANDLVWIDDTQQWAKTDGYFTSGLSKVYDVEFSNGDSVCVTPNHKFLKSTWKRTGVDTELCELRDLNVGDRIVCNHNDITQYNVNLGDRGTLTEGLITGWLAGDGCLSYQNDNDKYPDTILYFWEKDAEAAEFFHGVFTDLGYGLSLCEHSHNRVKRLRSQRWSDYFTNRYQTNIWEFRSKDLEIDFLNHASYDFISGFLRGLFSADGTVTCNHQAKNYNIQLSSVNRQLLRQIQRILMVFGIKSSVGKLRDCFRLTITGHEYIRKFKHHIGFLLGYKQDRLDDICKQVFAKHSECSSYVKIVSISPREKPEKVGCISVPGYKRFAANTIVSGNSELPLCENDSCRLLLLNLFGYVRDPFTGHAKFDWDAFYADAQLGQRYLDNLIDLEIECINRIIEKIKADPGDEQTKSVELLMWISIRDKCKDGRRTGLGQTGLGDALAALGIKYGSTKAVNFTEKAYRYLKFGSYRASVDMAKELGPFPVWDWEKEKDHPFILRFRDESIVVGGNIIEGYDLYHDIGEFGRRNIANLTTAPAGSVSIQTRTTSSAEPLYFFSWKRRKKVNPSDEGITVHETDANGDSWMLFDVFHPKVKQWMEVTGENDVKNSPWFGCCAEDLNPYDRIKMQAAAQKHVDHAISSTINLPSNVSQKTVGEIYEESWRRGLKGVTVYRAGSRDGVIINSESNDKPQVPEERPRVLPCDVHHTICDGEDYFVLVGIKDGKPHEVFAGRNGFLPPRIKHGEIIRKRKNYYQAKFEDEEVDLLSPITASTTEEQDIVTRLISLPLRTNVDMHVIVRQLEKAGEKGGMNSFTRGLARVLKKYIPDGTEEHKEACPECGISPMVRQEGCLSCKSCGWSKCI